MEIREFEYIVAIAEAGSLSLAAENLFISQPSLSKFLRKLEQSLGTRLFIRTSKGMQLTPSGEIYLENAKNILNTYKRTKNQINDLENLNEGRVDFGISTYRGCYLFPKIYRTFHDKYPNVDVVVHEHNSVILEEMVSKGELDLALVAKPEVTDEMEKNSLLEDEVILVMHKDYPLNAMIKNLDDQSQWIDLKDLSEETFILSPPRTILGKTARGKFRDLNMKVKSINQNCTAEMAMALTREGLGIAFNYRSCHINDGELRAYSIGKEKLLIPLILEYSSEHYRCRAAELLANLIHEYFNNQVYNQ